MKTYRSAISVFLALITMNLTIGCSPKTYTLMGVAGKAGIETYDAAFIQQKLDEQRHFLIHQKNNMWYLRGASLSEDKTSILGALEPLPNNYFKIRKKETENSEIELAKRQLMEETIVFCVSDYQMEQNEQAIIKISSILKPCDCKIINKTDSIINAGLIVVIAVPFAVVLLYALLLSLD